MERMVVEVAVLGASAAGLATAIAAAEAGTSVALLKEKAQIGTPPAPAAIGFDFLWPAAIDRPAASVRRRLPGVRLRAATGRGPLVDAPLTVFDRTRLDRALADRAEAAGVQVRTGVDRCRHVSPGRLSWPGGEVDARVVVFADGPFSLARQHLRAHRDPAQLRWGAVLEGAGDAGDRIAITLGHHARGGRSQLNPVDPGRWTHWTFYRGSPEEAEARARAAFAVDARLHGWKEPAARFVGVAADPVFVMPGELARGRIAAVGGAAGQGGLEVGLASGLMAGEAAAREARGERGVLKAYERRWRAKYAAGYRRLRSVTDLLSRLDDRAMDVVLGRLDGRAVPVGEFRSLPRMAAAWLRG